MARACAPRIGHYRTQALGTTAEILVSDAGLTGGAAAVLDEGLAWIDLVASRFRSDSELSRLNAAAGRPFAASPDLLALLEATLRIARLTDGLVTPTTGAAVRALGYDRDFEAIEGIDGRPWPEPAPVPDWRLISLDPANATVQTLPHVQIDLGSTAKAWAADRIAVTAFERLGSGVLVSLGGDVSLAGPAPERGWSVGVADRCSEAPDATQAVIALRTGGLATSGTATRSWVRAGRIAHHLIDPATGLPARACWRTVSVAAASCVDANGAATAAMILGRPAIGWLAARRLPARLVSGDGQVTRVGDWPAGTG